MCYHEYRKYMQCGCLSIREHHCDLAHFDNPILLIWCLHYTTYQNDIPGACFEHATNEALQSMATLRPTPSAQEVPAYGALNEYRHSRVEQCQTLLKIMRQTERAKGRMAQYAAEERERLEVREMQMWVEMMRQGEVQQTVPMKNPLELAEVLEMRNGLQRTTGGLTQSFVPGKSFDAMTSEGQSAPMQAPNQYAQTHTYNHFVSPMVTPQQMPSALGISTAIQDPHQYNPYYRRDDSFTIVEPAEKAPVSERSKDYEPPASLQPYYGQGDDFDNHSITHYQIQK